MKRLAEESHSIREKNKLLSTSNIKWEKLPQKIFIVHKETDLDFIKEKLEELIVWLLDHWRQHSAALDLIGVFPLIFKDSLALKSNNIQFYDYSMPIPDEIDLVVTLGGDGTVLLAAWLFQDHVPPIVPFHFGTLGFLTIFNWENFTARMCSILASGSRFNSRLRLNCQIQKIKTETTLSYNILNEIVVERGASPFMCILDIYGENNFLTKIQADGVAIATPTGSTAYSVKSIIENSKLYLCCISYLPVAQ
jgi:NAD+ kinase